LQREGKRLKLLIGTSLGVLVFGFLFEMRSATAIAFLLYTEIRKRGFEDFLAGVSIVLFEMSY
jgi:hypothetical protein